MKQEIKQIDAAEEYRNLSDEYCTRMRDHIDIVAVRLKEVTEHMNMNDRYHADALRSFTWGLIDEVEQKMKKIGRHYEIGVCNLRDIVVK